MRSASVNWRGSCSKARRPRPRSTRDGHADRRAACERARGAVAAPGRGSASRDQRFLLGERAVRVIVRFHVVLVVPVPIARELLAQSVLAHYLAPRADISTTVQFT